VINHKDHNNCKDELATQRIIKAFEQTNCGQPVFDAFKTFPLEVLIEMQKMLDYILRAREAE
jgi:hypothetical protein